MAQNRYLIEIVKAGVAQHGGVLTFHFIGNDPYHDNPAEFPVQNMQMEVVFHYENNAHNAMINLSIGQVSMANFGTLNDYYLNFPFDPPEDFTFGNTAQLIISASGTNDDGIPYAVAFQLASGNQSGGEVTVGLTYQDMAKSFANLNTRYTYCPEGDCFSSGTNPWE